MTHPAPAPFCRVDVPALVRLGMALRPDIDGRDLEGAVLALQAANWPWTRIVMQTAAMLCHGEEPRDLREAVADPLRKLKHSTPNQ